MRRLWIGAALTGLVVLGARALAPKLHTRMMAACGRMFEQLPPDFPPKRVVRGIAEIQATTARTLELLEERPQTARAATEEVDGEARLEHAVR
jgi:hypothetical protein